jgi:hypothetical protein
MSDVKKAYREAEETSKETWRNRDGEDLADKAGNLGDDVRKHLGNLGDDVREGLDKAGDKVRDMADDADFDTTPDRRA